MKHKDIKILDITSDEIKKFPEIVKQVKEWMKNTTIVEDFMKDSGKYIEELEKDEEELTREMLNNSKLFMKYFVVMKKMGLLLQAIEVMRHKYYKLSKQQAAELKLLKNENYGKN